MDLEKPQKRRRGAELETALLEATWAEIVENGYASLTFDAVAQRAGTSRPVLYRRWSTKADLVRAAVRHTLQRNRAAVPDTGSLRGDLIAVMRAANDRRLADSILVFSYLGSFFQETGSSPADLRADALGDRVFLVDAVFDHAVARGEVDPARLTRRSRDLAFDLYRHEALMRLTKVPDEVILEIVDEIVLPLLQVSR